MSVRRTVGHHALGLDGLALLRLYGAGDRDAADRVVAEMGDLLGRLDDPELSEVRRTEPIDVVEGYRRWAAVYDRPGNPVIDHEQPVVWELLDGSPGEPVLDAACGTGRHLAHLAECGRAAIGVDLSHAMLAMARAKLPDADLRIGELQHIPIPDSGVAGAVCGLALEHVADIAPVYAEFARVVRPGGWLIISMVHPAIALIGWHAWFIDEDGRADVIGYSHSMSDHVQAARSAGFTLADCREPCIGPTAAAAEASRSAPVGGPLALEGFPVVLVVEFERSG